MQNCTEPRFVSSKHSGKADGSSASAADAARTLKVELDVVAGATGSAFLSIAATGPATMVVCAVYGPRAVRSGNVFSNNAQLECTVQFSNPQLCDETLDAEWFSQAICDSLKSTIRLERFPKSVISIQCTFLQTHGSELSAAINCASLALASAGIDMHDLVCACTCVHDGRSLLVDVNSDRLDSARAQLVCACESEGGAITQLQYHVTGEQRLSSHELVQQ
jgi:ribonuclease PH